MTIGIALFATSCGASPPPQAATDPHREESQATEPDQATSTTTEEAVDEHQLAMRRMVITADALSDRFTELSCDPGWPAGLEAFRHFARSLPEVRELNASPHSEDLTVVYQTGIFHVFHPHPDEGLSGRCGQPRAHRLSPACGCGCLDPRRFCLDPADPALRSLSRDVSFCAAADYACPAGQTLFSDACGCGCLSGTPSCPDEDAAGLSYTSRDAVECEMTEPRCPAGQQPFPTP